jgi:drug/metabolite transporter (DMT)-like permease
MNDWIGYALLTVLCWGLYGVFLHTGALGMGDPAHGRIKAFLFVGFAYFLVAVLAPIGLLLARGASWDMPTTGAAWSLLAGIVGAVGALGVLLAYGAGGKPPIVMSIIFGCAPVVTALVHTWKHQAWSEIRWPFLVGIALSGAGVALVNVWRPEAKPAAPVEAPPPP